MLSDLKCIWGSGGGRRRHRAWPSRVLVVSLICAVLTGCKVPLYSGLDEKEANSMLGKLLEYSIDATKQADKNNQITLLVDEAQFGEAVELLKSFGLPRPKYETIGKVFTGDGLVTSPLQEWARLNFALSQELSNMVSSIPGVISAEVHIANPRKNTPFEELPPPSAAVLALANRDAITAELIPQIKQLVAHSVENVEYDRVGVVVTPVDPPTPANAELVALGGITMRKNSTGWAVFLAGAIVVTGAGLGAGMTMAAQSYLGRRRKGTA